MLNNLIVESNLENVEKAIEEKFDFTKLGDSSDMQSFCDELIKIGLFKDYKSIKLFLLLESISLAKLDVVDIPIFYIDSSNIDEYKDEDKNTILTDDYIKENYK